MKDLCTELPKISIVVPCYNEEESIPLFLEQVTQVVSDIPNVIFEYLFVDDGSVDNTLQVLRQLSTDNKSVRYVSFSRNFGKEAALLAGLEAVSGDYVALMDADLQHPPELLPQMYAAILNEGFDCVTTRRITRKGDPPIRSFFSKIFYQLVNKISDTHMVDGAGDFRFMTRQMVDAILSLKEYNRFSKGLFSWVGFSTKMLEFENVPRVAGSSKWSFWKLLLYSIDGIAAFSVRPLAISSLFGILFCVLSFIGIITIVVRWLMFSDPVAGWASTVTIILFVNCNRFFPTIVNIFPHPEVGNFSCVSLRYSEAQ